MTTTAPTVGGCQILPFVGRVSGQQTDQEQDNEVQVDVPGVHACAFRLGPARLTVRVGSEQALLVSP